MKLIKFKGIEPRKATENSACFDLEASEDIQLDKKQIYLVPTGLFLEIPDGWEGIIRPRSGLSTKGILICNSPGTIDSDYRGEIKIVLRYSGFSAAYQIKKGDRIAQISFQPVFDVRFHREDDLEKTYRQDGGFGSTGK